MAAFGWSFGDIVVGISIVWNVYQSLSDGPLNARLEFSQFFDEFAIITSYLDEWQSKAELVQGDSVGRLHKQVRQQCETFIKRHMLLIQEANPRSRAAREGCSTWLQNVTFSRDQVSVLYQRVQWPMERKEVAKLRNKLVMFLEMSTHSVTVENRDLLLEIKYLLSSSKYIFCVDHSKGHQMQLCRSQISSWFHHTSILFPESHKPSNK